MAEQAAHTLSKAERLCGRNDISRLLKEGKYSFSPLLRCCILKDNGLDYNRIMVSVPKKSFKRAVKRNLLKRRIRESYRLQKHEFSAPRHVDIMFMYTSKEVRPFKEIFDEVGGIIKKIK